MTDLVWARHQLFDIFPELKEFDNVLHLIYAGNNVDNPIQLRRIDELSEEILQKYTEGKTRFVFECFAETVMTDHLTIIHSVVEKIVDRLPLAKFYYLTGCITGEEAYNQFLDRNNLTKLINILSCYHQEYEYHKKYVYTREYSPGKRSKKFLCFNRMDRQHRIDILAECFKHDLVDQSYYSFSFLPQRYDDFKQAFRQHKLYKHIFDNEDRLPLILNRTKERDTTIDLLEEDFNYFEDSYFSVVTETVFYDMTVKNDKFHNLESPSEHGIFPTEKIYKAIAMKHPFIVVSTDGFLKKLLERGYRTFSPYIDETYDTIKDDDLRHKAITNEIVRLCSLPESQLIDYTYHWKDIVEYNRQHFFNMTDFRSTKNAYELFLP